MDRHTAVTGGGAGSERLSRLPVGAARPVPSSTSGGATNSGTKTGVVQPKPQALPQRQGPSSILVSPRQKGNPVLDSIRSMPWEYSDIPADFVLGATTCALFLSLKYHRLHPEYIYTRIKALQGKYNLRVLLTMVDIQNHEESLKELSKTSLINNVTIVLCWKAEEAGRYLELYKTYEFAAPTGIRAHQATSYSDRLVEFITVPRGINKTDAVSLVSNFGSIRTAINAQPEEIAMISGWGEKKVERWCRAVREPFRIKKAARRGLLREETTASAIALSREATRVEEPIDVGAVVKERIEPAIMPEAELVMPRQEVETVADDADKRPPQREAELVADEEEGNVFDEIIDGSGAVESQPLTSQKPTAPAVNPKKRHAEPDVSEGIMAALAKLRKS